MPTVCQQHWTTKFLQQHQLPQALRQLQRSQLSSAHSTVTKPCSDHRISIAPTHLTAAGTLHHVLRTRSQGSEPRRTVPLHSVTKCATQVIHDIIDIGKDNLHQGIYSKGNTQTTRQLQKDLPTLLNMAAQPAGEVRIPPSTQSTLLQSPQAPCTVAATAVHR
jgi:hypothetical protein